MMDEPLGGDRKAHGIFLNTSICLHQHVKIHYFKSVNICNNKTLFQRYKLDELGAAMAYVDVNEKR